MINIQLDGSNNAFYPRQPISGNVAWSELPSDTQTIDVRLIWYTTGKGDRDVEVVDSTTIQAVQPSSKAGISFVAPDYPYSFSGKLISLIWAIEVIAFPSREAEIQEITISPSGSEIMITGSAPESSASES